MPGTERESPVERGNMEKVPESVSHDHSGRERVGLRAVALFEALKGTAAFLAGSGLLLVAHSHAQAWVDALATHFHLNPARDYPRVFHAMLRHPDDGVLVSLAVGSLLYTLARFVEAYGLWRGMDWAKWFAVLSGGIYVPLEVWRLLRHPRLLTLAVLILNGVVVVFLITVMRHRRRKSSER